MHHDLPPGIKQLAMGLTPGQHKKKCPQCHHTRSKHKHDRSLSLKVDLDGTQFFCHHCGIEGGWMDNKDFDFIMDTSPRQVIDVPSGVNDIVQAYLRGRNLTDEVIANHTVQGNYHFNGTSVPAVGFPYRKDGGVVAIKWRSADDKKFYSQQNVCKDFFGLDRFVPGNDILLVEGEMDALSWLSCELPETLTVLSIPNGAPAKVRNKKVSPEEDKKFQYVWRAKNELDSAGRILCCFDSDQPGMALRDEIIRRIGSDRDVWLVDLGERYKDTSEALAHRGETYLLDRLDSAEPLPTVGLYGAEEFQAEFTTLYEDGQIAGAPTGIPSLDRMIQIVPGMMSVVTGFPSSGKSDLIDQIVLNLARSEGWKTVYCSFEKPVALHMAQLAQKLVDAPFFEGPSTRMSRGERDWAYDWCRDHFLFMDHTRQGPTDIDGILEVASKAVMRQGSRVLVIDPYNHLTLPPHDKETDAISKMLTSVQQWTRAHDAHCFFIAHPTKLTADRRSEKKTVVTGHDIAGSAAWFAKADIGITAWRHPYDREPPEAHVWKVRWNWLGKQGFCQLNFDRATGRWTDHVREVVDESYWDM